MTVLAPFFSLPVLDEYCLDLSELPNCFAELELSFFPVFFFFCEEAGGVGIITGVSDCFIVSL